MPEFAYQLPGVPPDYAGGLSAFTPAFGGQAGSGRQPYKYGVTGTMGASGVAAPTVNTTSRPGDNDAATMGTSRSGDAPDEWYPQQWYQDVIRERPGAGMPVQIYDPVHPGRTTVLPVPATAIRQSLISGQAMTARRAVLNRIKQLPWWPRSYTAPSADGAGNAPGTGDSGDSSAR